MSAAPSAILKAAGVDLNQFLNSAQQNRTLYSKFKEQLITEGIIKWHCHEVHEDIAVLTDINTTTGLIVPNSLYMSPASKIYKANTLSNVPVQSTKWYNRQHTRKILYFPKKKCFRMQHSPAYIVGASKINCWMHMRLQMWNPWIYLSRYKWLGITCI